MTTMFSPAAAVAQGAALNYVVTGDHRSGVAVLQSCLDQTPAVVCHGDLFFDEYGDLAFQDRTRREAHESYFGPPDGEVGKFPEWFAPAGGANPCRYLNDRVFDNPRAGEGRIGVRLLYHQIARYELFDLLNERWREGDFCLIHVIRNPVACLVSQRQAERSGLWRQHASSPVGPGRPPPPLYLDPDELVQAVRHHEAVKGKIRGCCPDALEVPYRGLVYNYQQTMERVFEFLEVPPQRVPPSRWKRLRNHDLRRRVLNFASLRATLPADARRYLEEDLL